MLRRFLIAFSWIRIKGSFSYFWLLLDASAISLFQNLECKNTTDATVEEIKVVNSLFIQKICQCHPHLFVLIGLHITLKLNEKDRHLFFFFFLSYSNSRKNKHHQNQNSMICSVWNWLLELYRNDDIDANLASFIVPNP